MMRIVNIICGSVIKYNYFIIYIAFVAGAIIGMVVGHAIASLSITIMIRQ